MFASLLLLAMTGSDTLAATPEWKQYKAVLAKHKVIVASVFLRRLGQPSGSSYRAGFEVTFWPDGSYRTSAWPQTFVWSSSEKRGLTLNHTDKTYRFLASQSDAPPLLSMLGIGKSGEAIGERELRSAITQTPTGGDVPSGRLSRESGYEAYSYHIDAGWRAVWMFDTRTHLMTRFVFDGLGPMAEESHVETQGIQWRFDTGEKFSFAPPKGYLEARSGK